MKEIDEISYDEAKLIEEGLSDQLLEHAIACSAPIIIEPKGSKNDEVRNGTCTLVKSPRRTFGITNAHVMRPAMDLHIASKGRVLVGQLAVTNFSDCLIDISDKLDLATFIVPDEALSYIRSDPKIDCRFSEYWPPALPVDEGGVFLAGWPGALKSVSETGFRMRTFSGAFVAQSTSSEWINVVRNRATEKVVKHFDVEDDISLGGLSGGPMFCMTKVNGFILPTLCGIVAQEYQEMGIIRGVRADLIDEYGKIRSL